MIMIREANVIPMPRGVPGIKTARSCHYAAYLTTKSGRNQALPEFVCGIEKHRAFQ